MAVITKEQYADMVARAIRDGRPFHELKLLVDDYIQAMNAVPEPQPPTRLRVASKERPEEPMSELELRAAYGDR
jgi:hypothetical protein